MSTLSHRQAFHFLSLEELKTLVPAAFTLKPAARATDHYIIIPTPEVLKDLEKLGWKPVDAHQMKAKLEHNEGYQKHFIRLRNENIFIGTKENILLIPEIIITNSYDARCSCKLYVGSYRPVSDNKTVCIPVTIPDPLDPANVLYSIPHRGHNVEEFTAFMTAISTFVQQLIDTVTKMQQVELKGKQLPEFAKQACVARWDYTYKLHDPKPVLEPLRPEDQSNDVWTVFNRLQEKIVKGGWIGSGGRKIKPLTNPDRELLVNRKLFAVAENFLQ